MLQAVARLLPSDASPLLLRVLQSASPLRSLEQLSDETGLDMAVLDRVVQHLQRWGKIRLIHPLTQESIFGVCPDAPLHASVDFERTFDIVETGYATLIALFCAGQPFGAVLRAAEELGVPKRRFVQMTLYLLQTHTLFQLHTYVHCVCEPPPPTAARSKCPACSSPDQRSAPPGRATLKAPFTHPIPLHQVHGAPP